MARAIVGTLLYVSEGKIRPDDIGRLLKKATGVSPARRFPHRGFTHKSLV
jgi:tRNA U38,U39,U40 pseudouridine synthase TruA